MKAQAMTASMAADDVGELFAADDPALGGFVYERLGFLIIEGRSRAAATAKGRAEGAHCPTSGGSDAGGGHLRHACRDDSDECTRARKHRDDMVTMWRNGIPLCIETLLCVSCELDCNSANSSATCCHGKGVEDSHSDAYVLLEQWTVLVLERRSFRSAASATTSAAGAPVSAGFLDLEHAVRSHLFFSQLSAWLHVSQGHHPKHVVYRLTAPGEWFRRSFASAETVSHSFPVATVGKRHLVKLSLASLMRTERTACELCLDVQQRRLLATDPTAAESILRSGSGDGHCLTSEPPGSVQSHPVEPELAHTCGAVVKRQHRSHGGFGKLSLPWTTLPPGAPSPSSTDKAVVQVGGHHRLVSGAAERVGAFSEAGLRSLGELKLIGCSIGCNATAGRTADAVDDYDSWTSAGRHPCHRGAVPPKSPKVLFSTWSRSSPSRPRGSDESDEDSAHVHRRSWEESEIEGGLCKARLTFEELYTKDCANGASAASQVLHKEFSAAATCSLSGTDLTFSQSSIAGNGHSQPFETVRVICGQVKVQEQVDKVNFESCAASSKSSQRVCTEEGKPKRVESFPQFSKLRLNGRPQFSSQCSPAPVKKLDRGSFHFDVELAAGGVRAIKSALSCGNLASSGGQRRRSGGSGWSSGRRTEPCEDTVTCKEEASLSTSAPAASSSSSCLMAATCSPSSALLGNFEETLLNGRIEPAGVVDGFTVDVGASGSFCPQHVSLPVKAYFFGSLSDDNAPSPYLGYVDLQSLGKRGYHIPRKGTLQVTLFNPNKKVVKMFVVLYDLDDMPPRSQTFLRQRTVYAASGAKLSGCSQSDVTALPTYLRYLIHLRFATSKTGKLYLHTDVRLIFARDKFEFDSRVAASYEMRSYTEAPSNPKFSPFV